jgi:hypothetical protein
MHYYYPLKYAKKRLLFEYKLDSDIVKYNLLLLFKIKRNLNVEISQKTWNKVVQYHARLRTYFAEKANIVYQFINPSCKKNFQFIYLTED